MLNLLVSKVCWGCNLKSLSITYSAPNMNCQTTVHICLTFARKPQYRCPCALTRIRRFFQIHSVQKSSDFAHIYLKNGRANTDNCCGTFDSNNLHLQPFSRFSPLLNFTRVVLPVTTLSPTRRSGGTNFIRSARSRRISSRCWISRCVCTAGLSISSFKRSCLVHVDVSCSGFMEAGSSELLVCFRSDLCQSGLVHFFRGNIHEC